MTDLEVRRVSFDFGGDVPFAWHPQNPEFAVMMNAVGVFVIGFEKYIVAAVRQAMPMITDPAVAAEADAFLRQEAQHARAHRMHMKALIRQYPGLQDTLDEVIASYDELFATKPLEYHLAYIADMEATFTPNFKLMLDHHEELFQPGDEQVASLFLWHFTEEVEHRSSGLIVYDHVVGRKWYRLGQLPSAIRHVLWVMRTACNGFNDHVPIEDRKVDANNILPPRAIQRQVGERFPQLARGIDLRYPMAMGCVPAHEQRAAYRGIIASQTPNHDPEHQPLPAFAGEWLTRYAEGGDVSHWYSSQSGE